MEEDGRFEVEGPVSDSGTTDVITGDFDDIDGKVRSDGALLEIDIEVEGADNAGPTGRCEETQPWRLEPRRSSGAARSTAPSRPTPPDSRRTATRSSRSATASSRGRPADAPDDVDGRRSRASTPGRRRRERRVGARLGSARATRIDALSGDELATVPLEAPERADAIGAVLPEMTASETTVWVAVDEVPRSIEWTRRRTP